MNSAAFTFIDTAIGGAAYRNNIQRVDAFRPDGTPDVYATYRRFTEDLRAYTATNLNPKGRPSVSGYNGPCLAPVLPFDIDVDGDLGAALRGTQRLLHIFRERWEIPLEALYIFYSGNKGFHVEIPESLFGGFGVLPAQISAARFKALSTLLVTPADSLPVDSAIYDATRLWRVPNTRNAKSGRYKVPLTAAELFTLSAEQIAELGQSPRIIDVPDADEWDSIPALADAWAATAHHHTRRGSAPVTSDDEPITQNRNVTLTSIAGRLRAAGLSHGAMEAALLTTNEERCQPCLDDGEVRAIAKSIARHPAGTLPPPPPRDPAVEELRERLRIAEAAAMDAAIVRDHNDRLAEQVRRSSHTLQVVLAELSSTLKPMRDKLVGIATAIEMHERKKSDRHTDPDLGVNITRAGVAAKCGLSEDSVTAGWKALRVGGHDFGRQDVARTVEDDSPRGYHQETDVWLKPSESIAEDVGALLFIETPRKQGGKRPETPKVYCDICKSTHAIRKQYTQCQGCGHKWDDTSYDINQRNEELAEKARLKEEADRSRLASLPAAYNLGKTLIASDDDEPRETLLATPLTNKDSETLLASHEKPAPAISQKQYTLPPPGEGIEELDPWAGVPGGLN